jgi:hypothetical protein
MIRLRRKYTSRQTTEDQGGKTYEGVSFFRGAPHIVTDAKGLAKAAATSAL